MYAVNLIAFMNASKQPEYLPLWLVLREVVTEQIVQPVKNKPGHDAVLVDVDADRWQAIVQIIRVKLGKTQFPLYEKGRSRWKKV